MIQLLTAIATKLLLSGNKLPIIKTCENLCLNFSKNSRIVELKLLLLTRFLSPNLLIYSYLLYFLGVLVVRCDRKRFSVLSPFIGKSMILYICIYFIYSVPRPSHYLVPSDALAHARVFGKTLHEFPVSYSHTEWYLLFSLCEGNE